MISIQCANLIYFCFFFFCISAKPLSTINKSGPQSVCRQEPDCPHTPAAHLSSLLHVSTTVQSELSRVLEEVYLLHVSTCGLNRTPKLSFVNRVFIKDNHYNKHSIFLLSYPYKYDVGCVTGSTCAHRWTHLSELLNRSSQLAKVKVLHEWQWARFVKLSYGWQKGSFNISQSGPRQKHISGENIFCLQKLAQCETWVWRCDCENTYSTPSCFFIIMGLSK